MCPAVGLILYSNSVSLRLLAGAAAGWVNRDAAWVGWMDGWNNGNRVSLMKSHKRRFKASISVRVAIPSLSVQAISDAHLDEFQFRVYSEVLRLTFLNNDLSASDG